MNTNPTISRPQVVVALTSFPAAIMYAAKAVQSILNGTVLPDKVVMYLTFSQFGEKGLPKKLLDMTDENPRFEIRDYPRDIRSYRKLIPALKDFPDATIVTIDDDVEYHKDMLRDLLRLHEEMPDAVLAHRAKLIRPGKPYRKWRKYRWYHFVGKRLHCSYRSIQTGVGGVLYPPHSLNPEMLDEDLFTRIAPTTDDIWFWAAAVANGVKVVPVPFGHNKPKGLGKPRELSLKTVNFKAGADRNDLAFKAVIESFPEVKRRLENRDERIIVSLTSFPEAIPYAVQAIRSILKGTLLPDKIVLYLDTQKFPGEVLPPELEALKSESPLLEVRFDPAEIRSYKKLIPALRDFPKDVIVTIDDDICYYPDMLDKLVKIHRQLPDAIIAHRVRRINLNKPYRKWHKYKWFYFLFKRIYSSYKNLQTGVGGVLYPPNCLKQEMLDIKLFTEIAPTMDDIWFWAAAVANETPIIPVPFGYHKLIDIEKPRELSLKTVNFRSGTDRNTATVKAILEKYPLIKQRVLNEK